MSTYKENLQVYESKFDQIILSNLLFAVKNHLILPYIGNYDIEIQDSGESTCIWNPDFFSYDRETEQIEKNNLLATFLPDDSLTGTEIVPDDSIWGSTNKFLTLKPAYDNDIIEGFELFDHITEAIYSFINSQELMSIPKYMLDKRRELYNGLVKKRVEFYTNRGVDISDDDIKYMVPIDNTENKRKVIDKVNRTLDGIYNRCHIVDMADIIPRIYPFQENELLNKIKRVYNENGITCTEPEYEVVKLYIQTFLPIYQEMVALIGHRIHLYRKSRARNDFYKEIRSMTKEQRKGYTLIVADMTLHDRDGDDLLESLYDPDIYTDYSAKYFIVG